MDIVVQRWTTCWLDQSNSISSFPFQESCLIERKGQPAYFFFSSAYRARVFSSPGKADKSPIGRIKKAGWLD